MPGIHRKHTIAERAYLAGFVDGEGCLSIQNLYIRRKGQRPQMGFRLGVVNTNRESLEWIKSIFGGNVSSRGKVRDSLKHSISYYWSVAGRLAEDVLREIKPYLKVKRLQAETALAFRKTFRTPLVYHHVKGRIVNTEIPDEVREKRESLKKEMHRLNKTGPEEETQCQESTNGTLP